MSDLQGMQSLPIDRTSGHTAWLWLAKDNNTSTGSIYDYLTKQKSNFKWYNFSKINHKCL